MVPSFSAIASLRCPLLNSQRIFAREWTTQQRTAVTAVTEQLISSCLGCTSMLMQRTPACTLLACASIFLGFVVLHKCGDETPARAKREHKPGGCQISDQCTRRRTEQRRRLRHSRRICARACRSCPSARRTWQSTALLLEVNACVRPLRQIHTRGVLAQRNPRGL